MWGVVATPFAGARLDVDVASLSRLVRHYERVGVTGLTVLGVLGEAARLSGRNGARCWRPCPSPPAFRW